MRTPPLDRSPFDLATPVTGRRQRRAGHKDRATLGTQAEAYPEVAPVVGQAELPIPVDGPRDLVAVTDFCLSVCAHEAYRQTMESGTDDRVTVELTAG